MQFKATTAVPPQEWLKLKWLATLSVNMDVEQVELSNFNAGSLK